MDLNLIGYGLARGAPWKLRSRPSIFGTTGVAFKFKFRSLMPTTSRISCVTTPLSTVPRFLFKWWGENREKCLLLASLFGDFFFSTQGNTHHDDFHLCGSGTSSPPVRLGHKVPALLMTVLMRPEDIKFTTVLGGGRHFECFMAYSRRSGHHALCERMEAACWQLWQMLKFGSWTSFEIDALVLKPRDLSVEVWARLGWIA